MAAGSRRHSGSLPLCFSSHCAERAFPLRAKKREAFFFVACYCRKRDASPYLSALLGQVSNGFSGGKKLVACFLKSKPLILKSGPLIFYLLLYWINALKISFHFFLPKSAVFRLGFSTFSRIPYILPAANARYRHTAELHAFIPKRSLGN